MIDGGARLNFPLEFRLPHSFSLDNGPNFENMREFLLSDAKLTLFCISSHRYHSKMKSKKSLSETYIV